MVTFDFRSTASIDWADGVDSSLVSTASPASYADDVAVPEVAWDTMASCSPDTTYPVSVSPSGLQGLSACWSTGFVTYPSPDPVPGTESTPGYRDPQTSWAPQAYDRETNLHDQWLQASYVTATEDGWQYQTTYSHNIDQLSDSDLFAQQHYFGSCRDKSVGGVKYQSLEDACGICFEYDNDYIDDVLSVMAKVANTPTSIVGFAWLMTFAETATGTISSDSAPAVIRGGGM